MAAAAMDVNVMNGGELDVRKLTARHYIGLMLGGERGGQVTLECFFDIMDETSKRTFDVLKQLSKEGRNPGKQLLIKYIPIFEPRFLVSPYLARVLMAVHLIVEKSGDEKQRDLLVNLIEQLVNLREQLSNDRVHTMKGEQICDLLYKVVEKIGIQRKDIEEMVKREECDYAIDHVTRYGRQNGIFCSPSFMVNGIRVPEGQTKDWDANKWLDFIKPLFEKKMMM